MCVAGAVGDGGCVGEEREEGGGAVVGRVGGEVGLEVVVVGFEGGIVHFFFFWFLVWGGGDGWELVRGGLFFFLNGDGMRNCVVLCRVGFWLGVEVGVVGKMI